MPLPARSYGASKKLAAVYKREASKRRENSTSVEAPKIINEKDHQTFENKYLIEQSPEPINKLKESSKMSPNFYNPTPERNAVPTSLERET